MRQKHYLTTITYSVKGDRTQLMADINHAAGQSSARRPKILAHQA
jgi:hypothetical protein